MMGDGLRLFWLSFFLCIVNSSDFCEVSIPYNSTNVCLSSGQYVVTDRIPPQMRAWRSEEQEPQITCRNEAIISCDYQSSMHWNRVEISNCLVEHSECREVTLESVHFFNSKITISVKDNSSNSTINDCLFNETNLHIIHSSESSAPSTIASSHFRLLSNHILGSSSLSFEDHTSGVQSYQELINNTYDATQTTPAPTTLQLTWSGAYDRENPTGRHLLVENNILRTAQFDLSTLGSPDMKLTRNHMVVCLIYLNVQDEDLYGHHPAFIEETDMNVIHVSKKGASARGPLNIRHNHMLYMEVSSNGTAIVVKNNDILNWERFETGGYVPDMGDIITDNTFTTFTYTIVHTNDDLLTRNEIRIDRNHFSRADITINTFVDTFLFMMDNVWTGPIVRYEEEPALHFTQILSGVLVLRNSSMDGYRGGGIKIASALGSRIHIESINISSCGKGGILMMTEMSPINLTSITLYNNTSPTVGGAVSISGKNALINLLECSLIDNRSPHSSALYISSNDVIQLRSVDIIVQDDIDQPLVDHSVVILNGNYHYENVSLSCAEERYLASSNASASLVWSCRPCASGTYFLGRGEVVEDVEKGNECTRCPGKGVECIDGRTPKGKPNYWCRMDDRAELICHNCPSGYCNETAHLWNSSCIGHRSGELCGGCADGYTLGFLTSACLPVDHCRHEWIALLSMVPVVYVAVLLFLPIGDGSMWKSMSYFVQTVPLLLKQERQSSIITMISSLFTMPTNMGSSFLGFCIGRMDYIEREFISLYIPFGTIFILVICLCTLGFSKISCTMPRRKIIFLTNALNKRSMLSRCTTGLVTGFLLMYSGLIASYLKLYFCIEIEPGRWVMYNAGTERCGFHVLGIIRDIWNRRKLKGMERETGRDVLMVLDGCYRHSTKYWESVYMVRRVVIAVAYVFITDESATVMRFLLLTALFLHLVFTPFVTAAGQWLETMCLLSLCCLTLLNGQLEEKYSHAFLIIIAVPFMVSLVIVVHKYWNKRTRRSHPSYEPLCNGDEFGMSAESLNRITYRRTTHTFALHKEELYDAESFLSQPSKKRKY
ncbi:hypothetical protein PROFUN_15061 [Planoprotostelium fungivorum]|uniref:Right handed beta helix domain-containing protein n=1 Tax=Planoprotostelium fungivorum TaxID=1890364 RepID=A0A2P6MXR4_9EUKA|nr:hypothetical protein PROFUN_15061 [Planoprotostelium fungivorum]